jgi:hypothetical protein
MSRKDVYSQGPIFSLGAMDLCSLAVILELGRKRQVTKLGVDLVKRASRGSKSRVKRDT